MDFVVGLLLSWHFASGAMAGQGAHLPAAPRRLTAVFWRHPVDRSRHQNLVGEAVAAFAASER
jgi:hypothetical protein